MKNNINFTEFRDNLNYLYVNELRAYCSKLLLQEKGKKAALIFRIVHFVKTGKKIVNPKYPDASCYKGVVPKLQPGSLMLKGAYKNDLRTRVFFKSIIGKHFHFTAFGIDWLDGRWIDGRPPTYQEFADMWSNEYESRLMNPASPKEEWAYINFVQGYLKQDPNASSDVILQNWLSERLRRKNLVDQFFSC